MTTPLVTRVLLADDHPVVRNGLRELLNSEPDFRVVAEVDDGVGLPAEVAADSSGIRGMRERALLVGGQLSVSTVDGGGTEVRLDVPLPGGGE